MKKRRLLRPRQKFMPTSYYQSSPGSNPEGAKKRNQSSNYGRGRVRQRHIGLIFTISILFAALAGFLLFGITGKAQVDIPNAQPELADEIETAANEQLQSGWNRLKPLLNNEEVAHSIATSMGSVYDIHVIAPLFSRNVIIRGEVRVPVASLELDGTNFILDQTGASYRDDTQELAHLPTIIDTSAVNSQAEGASTINLTQSTVLFVRDFNAIAMERKLAKEPITIVIGEQPREVIWKPADKPYEVKLIVSRDPLDQAKEYESLTRFLRRKSIVPSRYVDLRVDDTAYYQ